MGGSMARDETLETQAPGCDTRGGKVEMSGKVEVSGKVEMPGKVEMSGKVKCETSSEQPAKLRSDSPKSIVRFSHSLAAWGGCFLFIY